jgi:hypothetical protein
MSYLNYSYGLCRFHATNIAAEHFNQLRFHRFKPTVKPLETPLAQRSAKLAAPASATIAAPISSLP